MSLTVGDLFMSPTLDGALFVRVFEFQKSKFFFFFYFILIWNEMTGK